MFALQRQLEPIVREIAITAAPRQAQKLLEGLLGTLCFAYAGSLELSGRSFAPDHVRFLRGDVDALRDTFLGRRVLEEQVVKYSVTYLYALAENACNVEIV